MRVDACGICRSDLHVGQTGDGLRFPAVLGCGAVGLSAVQGARLARARQVIAVEP